MTPPASLEKTSEPWLSADWKAVGRAATERQAAKELDGFVATWGGKYPAIGKLWQENRDRLTPFFDFPAELCKMIYTTQPKPKGKEMV